MTKKIIDYSKACIYKICCKDLNIKNAYIGSTTNLVKRKNKHKYDCCNNKSKKYNLSVYQFIRNNRGFDNWEVVLIEHCECKNFEELRARERWYYEQEKEPLNHCYPGRNIEEWKLDNKEHISEYMKQYQLKNKDKLKEYDKQRYLKQKQKSKLVF